MAIGRKGHSWPVSYLGVLSYPLYLLHQDIGLIVIALAEPHLGLVGAAALALLSALALAAIVQWAIDLWQPPVKTMVRRLFRTFVWRRSEERRVGKECVSTCRSRWLTYH